MSCNEPGTPCPGSGGPTRSSPQESRFTRQLTCSLTEPRTGKEVSASRGAVGSNLRALEVKDKARGKDLQLDKAPHKHQIKGQP